MLSSRKLFAISATAATTAVSLWTWVPAASEPLWPAESRAQYRPVQSISYDLGSKLMSGYFVRQDKSCFVSVMVIEKSDPEAVLPLSAARVRLLLYPGQIAGLDSEEGRSINLTCGDDATTLAVDAGERDRLVSLQSLALPTRTAKSR